MKKIIGLLFLPLCLSMLSCSSDDDSLSANESFIFGSYNGFCQGNCAHLFKFENGQVFRDEMDRFDNENLNFSRSSEAELVAVAERLFEAFPELLKDSEEEVYGCPGCLDQSVLYIQITDNEVVRSWRLDSIVQEEWPDELKEYVNLLVAELEKIIVF